jgi:hypothetical protein
MASGLAFGPDGNLYVSSAGNGNVLRYDGRTGAFLDVFVPAGGGGLLTPLHLAWQALPPRNTAWKAYRSEAYSFSFQYPPQLQLSDRSAQIKNDGTFKTLLWVSGQMTGRYSIDGATRTYTTSLDVQVIEMTAEEAERYFSVDRPMIIGGLPGWIWVAPGGSQQSIHAFVSRGAYTYSFQFASNKPGWVDGMAILEFADRILSTVQFK